MDPAKDAPSKLSKKDERTLNSIFNPNLPFDDEVETPEITQEGVWIRVGDAVCKPSEWL